MKLIKDDMIFSDGKRWWHQWEKDLPGGGILRLSSCSRLITPDDDPREVRAEFIKDLKAKGVFITERTLALT